MDGNSQERLLDRLDAEIELIEDEVEQLEDDEVEVVEGEPEEERRERESRRRVLITIDNQDDGSTIRIRVRQLVAMQRVIDTMYEKFRLKQQADDRLIDTASGENVYPFTHLTLRDYLAAGHSPDHHWSFRGDSGGA